MDENVKARLIGAIEKMDTVMLTTRGDDQSLHARPMAVADTKQDGELWFVTAKSSEKTHEVRHDPRAVVTGQSGHLFVTVNGSLDVIDDRAKIAQLWKETWKAWFPNGKDDPNITLLRLRPEVGEYWDNSGAQGLKYAFEMVKAVVNGKVTDANDPKIHAKVPL